MNDMSEKLSQELSDEANRNVNKNVGEDLGHGLGQAGVNCLLQALTALKQGDFSARMPTGWSDAAGRVADTVNDLIATGEQTALALAEKVRLLSAQNNDVALARLALEEQASQLALSSKCKAEFLATMSHELRTPLNSLLMLAQQLADNPEHNLSARQVEFARTIHGSGSDLLALINDILDLANIESGSVMPELAPCRLVHLGHHVERTFRHVAETKRLAFTVTLAADLPAALMTDPTRLQQVLKNLLSNAFKFTHCGAVAFEIGLVRAGTALAFTVRDSGIGIAADKLQAIFEAFQQADGGAARNYGGTGLGLAIARELARLLGGQIRVDSSVGGGGTFTLYLPMTVPMTAPLMLPADAGARPATPASPVRPAAATAPAKAPAPDLAAPAPADDDRHLLAPGDVVVLIVAAEPQLGAALLACVRTHRLKGIVSPHGDSALSLARDYGPALVLLDLDLPGGAACAALDRLKHDPDTRHIALCGLTSQRERQRERALRLGAAAVLHKSVKAPGAPLMAQLAVHLRRLGPAAARPGRSVLLIEPDPRQRAALAALLGGAGLEVLAVADGCAALEVLARPGGGPDCIVLEPDLADVDAGALLDRIGADQRLRDVPLLIHTGRAPAKKELQRWQRQARRVLVKDDASAARLLDAAVLFLHAPLAGLPAPVRAMLDQARAADCRLAGRKVLIVDDDLRNIFALSALLERQQMRVVFAENGRDGIAQLEHDATIDIVLMDIMMPELDGYDTMRAIRRVARFHSLPILALTASAMPGDRERCIAAGASDYLGKPVDLAQLLSLLRVWLHDAPRD